jgi:hypothetical protein
VDVFQHGIGERRVTTDLANQAFLTIFAEKNELSNEGRSRRNPDIEWQVSYLTSEFQCDLYEYIPQDYSRSYRGDYW